MSGRAARIPRVSSLMEWAARQTYWRTFRWIDPLRGALKRSSSTTIPRVQAAPFVAELLAQIPIKRGPYLVHSSTSRFELIDSDGQPISGLSAAAWLLNQLKQFVGTDGTLCMPTHPKYAENPGFMFDKSALRLTYDVRRTPSNVGLLSELFRRQPGCVRSEHPLSSVAARGPLAEQLLQGNLDDNRPLPHGKHSPYYRICEQGGTVIGIGLSLIKAMTILHVAEEVQDTEWPVKDFFYDRQFNLVDTRGTTRLVIVRERRPEFVRSLMLKNVRHDLLAEGLMREIVVEGVPCATADARGVFEYMRDRQRTSTYPYLWPAIARLGLPLQAAVPSEKHGP